MVPSTIPRTPAPVENLERKVLEVLDALNQGEVRNVPLDRIGISPGFKSSDHHMQGHRSS